MVADLSEPAAGQQANPGRCGVEAVFGGKLLAADGGQRQLGQRMADELRLRRRARDRTLSSKGKITSMRSTYLRTSWMRCFFQAHNLRADEVNHGNAEPVKAPGQAEMDFGEVDEHGDGWPALADGSLELAELAIDARQMEQRPR